MKKIILSLVLIFGCLTFANAQENALGLKFGTGTDISFQRMLGASNRLEINVGVDNFDFDVFSASGLYQWVWGLDQLAPGFKWYAGVGAGIAFGDPIDFHLNVLGNIGIEYNFNFPLQLALDWTPGISLTPEFGDFRSYDGVRFAARWRF
jgi:hypothetical protein